MSTEKDIFINMLKEDIKYFKLIKTHCETQIIKLEKMLSELEQDSQPQQPRTFQPATANPLSATANQLSRPLASTSTAATQRPFTVNLSKRADLQNTNFTQQKNLSTPAANSSPPPATPNLNSAPNLTFLEDYNAFLKVEGLGRLTARKDFLKKYQIKAFDCTNFESRMRDPIPPPVFGSVDSIQKGIYWAIPVQGTKYAVLPNVNIYTENHHKAQAMGDVFISNFVGGSYKSVMVDKPAIFERLGDNWQLVAKGKITLSN